MLHFLAAKRCVKLPFIKPDMKTQGGTPNIVCYLGSISYFYFPNVFLMFVFHVDLLILAHNNRGFIWKSSYYIIY